jgi:hypothetical protein
MGLRVDVEPCLVWDSQVNKMVRRSMITVHLVGNKGSIFASAGPLYTNNPSEIFEATQTLRSRLIADLPGIDGPATRDQIIGSQGFDDPDEKIV